MRTKVPLLLLVCGLLATFALAQSISDRAKRDEITMVPDADPDMSEAFRRAGATLDEFLNLAKKPRDDTTDFAVKVAIHDGKNTEYFWVTPFTERNGSFSGPIDNEPRLVKNVKADQLWRFNRNEIVDWMYFDHSKRRIVGNFTTCALLKHEPPAEAEKLRKTYGLVCDG